MKPKRFHFRSTSLFGTPLRYGAPVFAGLAVILTGLDADAKDILRPNASAAGAAPAATSSGALTRVATEAARANSQDILRRTGQTLDAMRAMQAAARAAAQSGPDHLGPNLPVVPNGLRPGGLNPVADAATNPASWSGASQPVETVDGENVNVTIRQTTQQALLQWQTLNVGKKTTLTFDQSAGGANVGQWIAFNQVTDPTGNPTQILGNIKADGQVYLINRNGVIFGGSSQVNARGLTATSLSINEKLIGTGLLNNPDTEFLLSGLNLPGRAGDVTVQAGARISTPVSNDGNGGRVFLAGANVVNAGTISTPAGQTILAAGLQVGTLAHASDDPSIRGLDVYVGAVVDPASLIAPYAGNAVNAGLIESARGNITITGKNVNQSGVIENSTSVALNGSVNLMANYGAVKNEGYRSDNSSTGTPFIYREEGSVTFGKGSITRILPEYGSDTKVTGTELALRSQIEAQGKSIYLGEGAAILAPNAKVSFKAGEWTAIPNGPFSSFLASTGHIYLDRGAEINLAGTVDAVASVLQNYLTVTLRGPELSVAPLQRDSDLRGDTIVVDITRTGTYNGRDWVGTPLADVSGYLNLIERDVAQLTTAGGTLDLSAGGSVVIREGAKVDVSGGWTNFVGDTVQTTKLRINGRLVDIADATPDQVYGGIFSGTSTIINEKWGVSETYVLPLAPTGKRYQATFTEGAAAGGISISSPSLALDGKLTGISIPGDYQNRASQTGSKLPASGALTLKLQAQLYSDITNTIYTYFPTRPTVIFGSVNQEDVEDFDLDSPFLSEEREGAIYLAESLVSGQGFGNLTVINEGGDIVLPESVTLTPRTGSQFSLTAANIDVLGRIVSPGSILSFKALNLTSYDEALAIEFVPPPNPGRGVLTLGASALLNTAGLVTDGRIPVAGRFDPIVLDGGQVNLIGYSADLRAGGRVNVSGGYVMTSAGNDKFGEGGAITIEAGVNPGAKALGGFLSMQSLFSGYSGSKGGTLNIQAPHILIGGNTTALDTLALGSEFFSQGGFATFRLTGLGVGSRPGVLVTSGTQISPVVQSLATSPELSSKGALALRVLQDIVGKRTPVSLTLASPGVRDRQISETGDVIIESGSVIRTDPGGNVRISGGAVSILGSIFSPGGSISAGGGSTSGVIDDPSAPVVTTYLGPGALLDASGAAVYLPDNYRTGTGKVLRGGDIVLTGNISASSGAVLNVSGASAVLAIDPDIATPIGVQGRITSGLTAPPRRITGKSVTIDSDAGTITLTGREALLTDATLLGNAGGTTALGGNLVVSSGTFAFGGTLPSKISLTVSQTGGAVAGSVGQLSGDGGRFAVDSFATGGFDSLTLGGVVSFSGNVDVFARRELTVSSDGFLYADGVTRLAAAHTILGRSSPLVLPEKETSPFGTLSFLPSYGTGSITIESRNINLGYLSLQGIGNATLQAASGDIHGAGTVQIAGNLTLRAGQIYPNTASNLSLIAYDYLLGGVTREGAIQVESLGTRSLPYSAGGTLSLYASNISQRGTLRAPFGTINLGWDGTATRPVDILAGSVAGSRFPVTKNLTLGAGSVTSVSAVDPLTGVGLTIPYGISTTGENWISPRGVDITTIGAPPKSIVLQGSGVTTEAGSTIDLRGGGDLYAYRWVEGLGGPTDILETNGSFAVIPTYETEFAPVSLFNTDRNETSNPNLIAGNTGYTNPTLKIGDRIYLSGSGTLAAGYYTLLPARYALLPGAVLVSPTGGSGAVRSERPDGSSLVTGYRFNGLNSGRTPSTISTRFEVASSDVVRARSEYEDYSANTFLKNAAQKAGILNSRLPVDSGALVFQATQSMNLLGNVASSSNSGGRGAVIDISTPLATVVTSGNAPAVPGSVYLNSNTLSSFGAESLLIGGRRTTGSNGSTVAVTSGSVTVDNHGSTLSAGDLILVSRGNLSIVNGASLASTGAVAESDDLILSGNGTLLRVSSDRSPGVFRSGITSAASPLLSIGAGATLAGGGITFDSSAGILLNPLANLAASNYQFNAGSVSLLLDNPGVVPSTSGLLVSNSTLRQLSSANALGILSYSTIDLYGSGTFGSTSSLASLSLSAGQIRNRGGSGSTARIAADYLRLDNAASAVPGAVPGTPGGNLEFLAGVIELGRGNLAVNGYSSVLLDASRGVTGQGIGGFSTQGDLTVRTPVLTGAANANRTLSTDGVLSLVGSGSGAFTPGLGSILSITGGSVNVNTAVSLPSGSLSILATTGNLTVGGRLDVSGTLQQFHDVTRITSAGDIKLSATAGNVVLTATSALDLSSPPLGGNGGQLSVFTPAGSFSSSGSILAFGGNGGKNGGVTLDVLSLPNLASLNVTLAAAGLTENQSIRVRSGNVLIDGIATARDFQLAADAGDITVSGMINASGPTGGSIHLAARGNVITESGSVLTVAGAGFSNAGKGGSITLESGTQLGGVAGTGSVDIRTGSVLDLSVSSKIAGSASSPGTSAYNGQFSGKLHIRAPRTSGNDDLLVGALNGVVIDASSILVEGYRIYDLTSSGGTITSTVQGNIRTDATNFLGAAGSNTANYTNISNRLLANNTGLADVLVLAPGVEIINRTGDLTLGTSSSTTTSDWDLSGFRFGAKSGAGVLTLRAAGDLVFYNALSDGFTPTLANSNASWLWTARLAQQNGLLPVNEQSWSYRLTAGADFTAAGFSAVMPISTLAAGKGSVKLGKDATNLSTATGPSATTLSAITNRFQVIRTGSGNIDVNAAGSIQLLNQFATIYTAGTAVADISLGGLFTVPRLTPVNSSGLGVVQQTYPVQYSMAGGDVNLRAGGNIERLTLSNGQLVADSQLQMPTNWLYKRGYVDAATGVFGIDRDGLPASTTWWVDFSNFFQGIGALGGGDVTLSAAGNISNVDAVIPTNARMPGYTSTLRTDAARPDASRLVELGGGNLTVVSGRNIDAGVYYVERGVGRLSAGGGIHTNATRSALDANNAFQASTYTQLPTTLFLGKGIFDVRANGEILLGPVANPFLLPGGQLNGYFNKSYFSTYQEGSGVTVESLGGNVTLRTSASQSSGFNEPLLALWYRNKLLLTGESASARKPWLRLSERDVDPFISVFALQPGTVSASSFNGDLNLAGDLVLSPSRRGNVSIFARGSINALQPNGILIAGTSNTTYWSSSRINLSDANPSAIPGISNPFAYQALVGTTSLASSTQAGFLDFIKVLFEESGDTLGANVTLQAKQNLHSAGPLHLGDTEPLRLYAETGDISGLTLFSPKVSRVIAGGDISDIAFYIQNVGSGDTSVVASGRDLLPYTTTSLLRQRATTGLNVLAASSGGIPRDGDIQISGPGTLQVLAGRDLDLGIGSNNPTGTGTGITSIGNTRNPYLPDAGANLVVGAGIGLARGLSDSALNLAEFINTYVLTEEGAAYVSEISPGGDLANLSKEEQSRVAVEVFNRILRDAGRAFSKTGNYQPAFEAIAVLFGSGATAWNGEVRTRSRDIRTSNGGDITLFAPGGGVTLASSTTGSTLAPPGIVTASGGNISIFANNDVSIGIGRIFTLRGGNEIIWSSKGDIAAGSSSKTVQTASPTRVRIDPQSGAVQTDLAGLATGGGIGVLASVAGVIPGDVDLIAPEGTVDAGDAGIRVSGNLNISATQVLNSSNIAVSGNSAGTSTPVSVGASIGAITSAATTGAAATATETQAERKTTQEIETPEEVPSLFSVEVIGYGDAEDEEEEEDQDNP